MATFAKSVSRESVLTALMAGVTLILAGPATALAAGDPTGIWYDDQKRGAIEIKPCGKGLCGHVVWVKAGENPRGCGKKIIGDVVKVSSSEWDNGWIYSPERKKTYSVALEPIGRDKLQVVGYAGSRLFSKTMTWTRAPAGLERCDAASTIEAKKPEAPGSAPAVAEKSTKVAAAKPAEKVVLMPPARSASQALAAQQAVASTEPAEAEAREPEIVAPKPVAAGRRNRAAAAEERPLETAEAPAETEEEVASAEDEEADPPRGRDGPDLDVSRYFKKSGKTCTISAPFVTVKFACDK